MKKQWICLLLLAATLLPGCAGDRLELPEPPGWVIDRKDDPRRMRAPLASGIYNMDNKESVVHWVGKKKWPYIEYKGTLNLTSGRLVVSSGNVTAGDFTVDMNSLDIVSLKDSPKEYAKMMDRLRNNFFYVNEYPTIHFQILSVTDADKTNTTRATHLIAGKLTIKGKTNPITLPATVILQGEEVKAYSRFSINRNDYNILYNEDSFFGGIGDAAIKDSIDMALELTGVRVASTVSEIQ